MKPNEALLNFHRKRCPELQMNGDRDKIFYKLLTEIKKIKDEK
jgi:hypothetical protein